MRHGLRNLYPQAEEQRRWNHRILNVLDKLPKKHHAAALEMPRKLPCADTVNGAEKSEACFQRWARDKGFERSLAVFDVEWEEMPTPMASHFVAFFCTLLDQLIDPHYRDVLAGIGNRVAIAFGRRPQ